MSKGNETVLVGVTVSLGLLLLVGAGVGGYLLVKKAAPGPVSGPAVQPQQVGSGLVVGNGVVATVGSGNTGWNAQQAADAERKREEEWRKNDKISQLEREFTDVTNRLKELSAEVEIISKSPMPADIIMRWSQQHQSDCRNSRPLVSKWSCNATDLTDGYQAKADADWEARKQTQLQPKGVEGDRLNTRQHDIISNLAALGVIKQPVNVRVR